MSMRGSLQRDAKIGLLPDMQKEGDLQASASQETKELARGDGGLMLDHHDEFCRCMDCVPVQKPRKIYDCEHQWTVKEGEKFSWEECFRCLATRDWREK